MPTASRDQFVAVVQSNTPLCREHYRLTLSLAHFPPTAPGQFVQLACRDLSQADAFEPMDVDWLPGTPVHLHNPELLQPQATLRRPFSLAGRRDLAGGVELDVIHRVVGVGTEWLSHLRSGDRAFLLGPLGNTFTLPTNGQAILVGGGVGIPPMLYLSEKLADKLAGRSAVAFAGALTRDLLPLTITQTPSSTADPTPCISEFARHGIPSVITTDDGSLGYRGFVTQALERYLDTLSTEERNAPPQHPALSTTIYTCGPEPMMKHVAEIAAARNIECQVAVERAMACGMGTCQSCCIRVRKPDPDQPPLPGSDWCYRLACTDGPVFRGADLLW